VQHGLSAIAEHLISCAVAETRQSPSANWTIATHASMPHTQHKTWYYGTKAMPKRSRTRHINSSLTEMP